MSRMSKMLQIIFHLHEKRKQVATEDLDTVLKDAAHYFAIKNTLEIIACIFLFIKIGYNISNGVTLTPGFLGSLSLIVTAIIFFVLTVKIITIIYSGKAIYDRYVQFNKTYLAASKGVPYYFYIPVCLSGIFYFITVLPEKGVGWGSIVVLTILSIAVTGAFLSMNYSLVSSIKRELEFLKCSHDL